MISQSVSYPLCYYFNCFLGISYSQKPATAMPLNQLVQQAVSSKSTLYLDFVHHLFLLLASKYIIVLEISADLNLY